jgi:TonB family protein
MIPDTLRSQNPDIPIPSTRGNVQEYPELAASLKDLDRYISSGSGGNTGGGGGGSGGGQGQDDNAAGAYFDTQGYDLGPWGDQVVALVRRNWSVPPAADLGMKGIVSIAFNVNRNGRLEDIRIISSSGIPSFDQAAVNALKISDPFIPLPTDFPRPKLPAVFRFFYNVPVPAK